MKQNVPIFRYLIYGGLLLQGCLEANTQEPRTTVASSSRIVQEDWLANHTIPDCVDLSFNTIQTPREPYRLHHFYQLLNRLQQGESQKINIVHLGGSHVQAGQLTAALRQRFNNFTPNARGERGFVFPSRLVKSNGPDYTKIVFSSPWLPCKSSINKHACQWGMAGQLARTTEPINTLKTWAFDMDSSIFVFDAVRIYRQDVDNAFELNIVDNAQVVNNTESYIDIEFDEPQDTLMLGIVKGDKTTSSFELQGFLFRNQKATGISYHALGVNGAGIGSYLRCNQLEEQLRDIVPDLIVVGLGLNDTYVRPEQFNAQKLQQEYQQMIDMLLRVNPDAAILLLTNNDHFYQRQASNQNAFLFNKMIEELAHNNQLATWDLFHLMGGANSILEWERLGLAKPDLIHFTDEGYHLQANLLYTAIMQDFNNR